MRLALAVMFSGWCLDGGQGKKRRFCSFIGAISLSNQDYTRQRVRHRDREGEQGERGGLSCQRKSAS